MTIINPTPEPPLAIVQGATDTFLCAKTLGTIIHERAQAHGDKPLAIFPWQNIRLSFKQLAQKSRHVAMALLHAGIRPSDCVAIMAGNRHEYLEVVVGGALIGCPVLVVNNTYKPWELENALRKTECRALFIAANIGSRTLSEHFEILSSSAEREALPYLDHVVTFDDSMGLVNSQSYDEFLSSVSASSDQETLLRAMEAVDPSDILSLQFTSGTTDEPKASMLSHTNLLNNALFLGQILALTTDDIICCPPPLFHGFGLVNGFFTALIHGATIVFPSDHFSAPHVLDSIVSEKCTVLIGVPTMFVAEMEANKTKKYSFPTLRRGLTGGSPVSVSLIARLKEEMGIDGMLIAYGMTETSTITFVTRFGDSAENRARTVGRVMPHTAAKVVDRAGEMVRVGERGEICISGYGLQRGYLNNEVKTRELMKVDGDGVLWVHTGDECVIDKYGYCRVTGRIKDIIIRGGENIFPAEIEDRLLAHKSITEVSVIGVPDSKYGEVVGCFVKTSDELRRPAVKDIQDWVRMNMGFSKTPQYVFFIGRNGVCLDFPKTGSGKHQKHLLRDIANALRRGGS